MPVDGRFAAVEETLTIVPAPRSRIPGNAARVARTALSRLSSNEACQIVVGHVLELPDLAVADVVDEHVEAPVPLDRLLHDALRLARLREVGPHVAAAAAGRHDRRSLGPQELRRLEPDPAGGAGDEADAVGEAEVHGWLA